MSRCPDFRECDVHKQAREVGTAKCVLFVEGIMQYTYTASYGGVDVYTAHQIFACIDGENSYHGPIWLAMAIKYST